MKGLRIRPEKTGLRASLFDLEADIMEIVWAHAWTEFAVAQVHHALEASRTIAYTTVMTTVTRLFKKELLTRHKDGRRYLYQPLMTQPEFLAAATRKVLTRLPALSPDDALALLVDQVATADDAYLDRLEALIKARRDAGQR